MSDPTATHRPADPVADVLLDFQSVMAQFLELQRQMIGVAARRPRPDVRHAGSVLYAPPPVSADGEDTALTAAATVAEPSMPAAEAPTPISVVQPAPVPIDPTGFCRYTLVVRERALGDAYGGIAPDRAIIVTDDGRGIARRVADRLCHEGRRVAIVAAGGSSEGADGRLHSPLDSAEEARRLVERIEGECGPAGALIHLMPLADAPAFDLIDGASWWRQLSAETRTLFLLAQALGASLEGASRNGGAAVVAATAMGGTFGFPTVEGSRRPAQGGVPGFAKCLAVEWPDVRVRAVDFSATATSEDIAEHVLSELWSADTAVEIGYSNGRRVTIDVVPTPGIIDLGFALPSDAVILATGGARGITAEVCLELAERYQPTFVLVGQSPPPPLTDPPDVAALTIAADLKRALTARLQSGGGRLTPAMVEKAYRQLLKQREIRATISRLNAAGARTHYVQLDVADEKAFSGLLDEIYASYGRIDGVVHGAGIIEDKLVREKALDSFDRVLRTKAMSAFVLSRCLRPESLRFITFFSSVAARFGNRGQADYAAANEVVSKLAGVLQERWPGRVCAIAWAPWDKLGMVSPELKQEFARRGIELLPPAAGRRALWEEIQQGASAAAEVVISRHAAVPLAAPAPERASLPLLEDATRKTTAAGALRFLRELDLGIDLYLRDHQLDGRPVLPLAFAAELMAEAAQAAFADLRVVAIRDLQLLKGIAVSGTPEPIVISVRGSVHSNDHGLTEADVEIATPASKPPVRYRAVVQLAARVDEPPPFEVPAWPLQPLSRSLERAYRDWTFHGPLFQRVTGIAGIAVDAIVGSVYSASVIPALAGRRRPDWIVEPFVFDAALQLVLMWSRALNNMTALPTRFRAFRRYASLADEPLTCYVAIESRAAGHALVFDVHFVDAAGRVRAILDGMEASCAGTLNRLTGAEPLDESRS